MTSISKNVFIKKLDDLVKECNNTYHITIIMKSIYVKSSININFGIENYKKNPKFEVGSHVRISKYKTFLQKVMLQIGLKKGTKTVMRTYVIEDLNGEEIVGQFYIKELQKTNQKEFRVDNSFNSWIGKKDDNTYSELHSETL